MEDMKRLRISWVAVGDFLDKTELPREEKMARQMQRIMSDKNVLTEQTAEAFDLYFAEDIDYQHLLEILPR